MNDFGDYRRKKEEEMRQRRRAVEDGKEKQHSILQHARLQNCSYDIIIYFPHHDRGSYLTAHPSDAYEIIEIQIFRDKTNLPGGWCLAVHL